MTTEDRRWFSLLIRLFGRNWITLFGTALTTSSAFLIVGFIAVTILGWSESPYYGIVGFLIMPGVFIAGLLLIPFGVYWERKKRQRAGISLTIDLKKRDVRGAVSVIGLLTAANVLIMTTVSYQGVVYMDSAAFCGQVCHGVMKPEFTAHAVSPHSRVTCVECHIGPGAPWFVRSKLSGVRQVFAVALHTYERPIPTPVENLRPSRDTCEECHWPQKFTGDRVRVVTEYSEDEANTPLKTVLLMHIGGGAAHAGIHSWHINPKKETTYIASDKQRQKIALVRVKDENGTVTEYRAKDAELTPEQLANGEVRMMDCIDCHNRPTHILKMPNKAMDEAMDRGLIDATLPFIKKVGVEALKAAKGGPSDLQDIDQYVRAFYQKEHADVAAAKPDAISTAITELQTIYSQNVFPDMNVTWGTYPNNIGHIDFPGCFRCHDDNHVSSDGKTIPQDCDLCHSVLSMQEENPAIVQELGLH